MNYTDLSEDILKHHKAYDNHHMVRRFVLDEAQGIVAFIAVHNNNLGPALGGCRIKPYKTEDDAIHDVLRLSRGMTYKNAMADLPLGGGKAVIMADPKTQKTSALMEKFGQCVDTLEGLYVTAEDSGTGEADMEAIHKSTRFVTGLSPAYLQSKGYEALGGNPSPLTALGCFEGIKAAVRHRFSRNDLSGMKVAIQGIGAVGFALAEYLSEAGAALYVADIDELNLAKAKEIFPMLTIVPPNDIYDADVDIFIPAAMGASINDKTISRLTCHIIAGPANNQLERPDHAEKLDEQKILYVPDYIINAGGVICVGYEFCMTSGKNPYDFTLTVDSMTDHVKSIGKAVGDILRYAEDHHVNTAKAADQMAEAKFSKTSTNQGSHSTAV